VHLLVTRADISPGTVPLPDSVAVLTPRFLPQRSVPVAGLARIPGAHVLEKCRSLRGFMAGRGPALAGLGRRQA
jgi:hypothetical protein